MATGWWPQPMGLALGPPLSSSHLELNRTVTRTRRKPQRPPREAPSLLLGLAVHSVFYTHCGICYMQAFRPLWCFTGSLGAWRDGAEGHR